MRRGREDLADALLELQDLTERLRRDCPWDRVQNARTIVPHTIEEAYEVADAALADEDGKLHGELGDLLFQVVFLALLLAEKGHGDLETVARGVHQKLVARHPHVFQSPGALQSAGDVKARWEDLKREQEGRQGIFHDVPGGLPALLYARKIQRRAAAVGFDYPDLAGVLADLEDELAELRAELAATPAPAAESPPDERQAAELGDVLFAVVNVARRLNADPELELRRASDRFATRVEHAAELAAAEAQVFSRLELHEQDRYFDLAKQAESAK